MSSNKAISSALVSSPPLLVQSKTGNQNKSVMCHEGCSVFTTITDVIQFLTKSTNGKDEKLDLYWNDFLPRSWFSLQWYLKSQTDRQGAICSSYRMVYNVWGSSIVLLTILSPSAILLGISVGNSVIDKNMFLRWCHVYVRVGQCTMRLSMKIKETKILKSKNSFYAHFWTKNGDFFLKR